MLPALYLLLTLACAGALLALLHWPGKARAGAVWGLAALLPLLAALTGALAGQARAERTLAAYYTPRPVTLTVVNGAERRTLTLEAQAAACVERAVRLRTPSVLLVPRGRVFLVEGTRVTGDLPPRAVVEALGIRGDLSCPSLRTLTEEERAGL